MQRRDVLKALGMAAGAQFGTPALRAFADDCQIAGHVAPNFFINQLGYLPQAAKVATVRGVDPAQTSFRVRSTAADNVVFEAALTAPQLDALSGDTVRQAVFSSFNTPGEYVLEAGPQRSDPFPLRGDAYALALRTTMRGYTGQRCGCAVELGNGYQHPPCHLDGAYGATSGKSGSLPNAGGWHDAGDYGRYVVNSGITCGTLLWAWEMYPQAVRTLDLGISGMASKSASKLPDYLNEVLWNLNWMLELQDADGGVFHKQTSEHFCAFIMPQDDHLVSEVIGTGAAPFKSTAATADVAAVMAIASRCYAEFDPALAARFRMAAEMAWKWAIAHPDVPFDNPPSIKTGSYADPHCSDEIAWASAELWRTTGEAQYEQAFLNSLPSDRQAINIGVPSWGNVASMACWTYAMATRPGDPAVKAAIRDTTQQAAQRFIAQSRSNGYGNTMTVEDYGWGSNSEAGNQSLLLLVANRFQPNAELLTTAMNNLHYLLGRNCHGVSWVTQLGVRPFLHPHHRPSVSDGLPMPWPGLLSGGPNRRPGDAVAKTLPQMPPMRMWIDDYRAYSMNEIAINWNAPLVFMLAAANA